MSREDWCSQRPWTSIWTRFTTLMAVTSQPRLADTSSIALATTAQTSQDGNTPRDTSCQRRYLADAEDVVQHGPGVGGVVAAGEGGPAQVGLQQQLGLGVGAGVGLHLQGELLSQLLVQLLLVVAHRQLGELLGVLRTDGGTG